MKNKILFIICGLILSHSSLVVAGPVIGINNPTIYQKKIDKKGFFTQDNNLYYDGYKVQFYYGEPKINYNNLEIIKLPRLNNYYHINKYLYYLKQVNTTSYRDGISYRLEPLGYYKHDELIFKYNTQDIVLIKNKIYIQGKYIKGINADKFNLLGYNEGIWVGNDKSNVYYNGRIVDGADINSFQLFNQYKDLETGPIYSNYIVWGKDKNNIYYGGKVFADDAFYKNKKYLKFIPTKPNVTTFRLYISDYKIGDYHAYRWWGVDDKNIFNIYGDIRKILVNYQKKDGTTYDLNPDGKTFELTGEKTQNGLVIGNGLAKDKNNIYLNHKIISNNSDDFKVLSGKWSYDNKNLYYNNILVNEDIEDLNTFTIKDKPFLEKREGVTFGDVYIASDKNNTYLVQINKYNDEVEFIVNIDHVNTETFEHIPGGGNEFYGDKNYIYSHVGNKLEIYKGTKNNNFYFLNENFRDFYSNNGIVFYKGIEIKGSNSKTFQRVGGNYAFDKNQGYFFSYYKRGTFQNNFKVKYLGKVDNETFMIPYIYPEDVRAGDITLGCNNGLGAKDKFHLYCDGVKQNFITLYKYYIIILVMITGLISYGYRRYKKREISHSQ